MDEKLADGGQEALAVQSQNEERIEDNRAAQKLPRLRTALRLSLTSLHIL